MVRVERRARTRRVVDKVNGPIRLRMRLGPDLDVLEVSDTGALVETIVRLAPGARLDVHVTNATGRVLVRSRVVRSFVTQVRASAMRYRAAMAFDNAIDSSPAVPEVASAVAPAAVQPTRELSLSG